MERYRLKQVIVEAEQWLNEGDVFYDSIGHVDEHSDCVSRDVYLSLTCSTCRRTYADHGLMREKAKTVGGKFKFMFVRVCPGEWITNFKDGIHCPISEEHFRQTYELDV